MPREFEIDAYRKGQELLLTLTGSLTLKHCPDTKTRLHNLFSPQIDHIYLDLSRLDFLDSAGLGVLVGLKMAANKHRTRLTFLSPPTKIEDIFRVSKLDTIFEVHGGAEADVICSALKREENIMWRDNRDTGAGLNTDYVEKSPAAARSLTPQPLEPQSGGKNGLAKQLSDDAVEFIRQGDYDKAIDCYERVLGMEPANLSALNNLGIVYEKKPEWYPKAIAVWKRVQELSRNSGDDKHAARAMKHLDTLSKLLQVD